MQHDTQLAKQVKHYGSIHARLMNPKNAVKAPTPRHREEDELCESSNRAVIGNLRSRLFEAEQQIKLKQELVNKLVLDLSDAHARIMSQASQLSTQDDETSVASVKTPRKPVTQIIDEVLSDFPDVSWEEIKGVRRTRHLIVPRQRLMYEIYRQRPDLSFPSIGRMFGGRDHTTVLHAVHKVRASLNEEGQ